MSAEILLEPVAYLAQNPDGTYDAYHDAHALVDDCRQGFPVFTADQMRTFAQEAARQAMERCAEVCDVTPPYPFRPSIEAAHAIRALLPQSEKRHG